MSQNQVKPKSEDLNRSLEINAIWIFDTEFLTIFNKSCTYITFKKYRLMTNQVERTKCVSLRNNEKQNQRQALLKMF